MSVDDLNIANLTALWKLYGSTLRASSCGFALYGHDSWPLRYWLEQKAVSASGRASEALSELLDAVPAAATVPLWNGAVATSDLSKVLLAKGFVPEFEQQAMYMHMPDNCLWQGAATSVLEVMPVEDVQAVRAWVTVVEDAFGYCVDAPVIERLLGDASFGLYLGMYEQQPAVTGLLYKTAAVVGVHQLGVSRVFQGRGLARSMMENLLSRCVDWHADYVVLQASEAGLPLYERLGFVSQFSIVNYSRR